MNSVSCQTSADLKETVNDPTSRQNHRLHRIHFIFINTLVGCKPWGGPLAQTSAEDVIQMKTPYGLKETLWTERYGFYVKKWELSSDSFISPSSESATGIWFLWSL